MLCIYLLPKCHFNAIKRFRRSRRNELGHKRSRDAPASFLRAQMWFVLGNVCVGGTVFVGAGARLCNLGAQTWWCKSKASGSARRHPKAGDWGGTLRKTSNHLHQGTSWSLQRWGSARSWLCVGMESVWDCWSSAGMFTLGVLSVLWPAPHGVGSFNLYAEHPTVYKGPVGSYFGYSVDFYQATSDRNTWVEAAEDVTHHFPYMLLFTLRLGNMWPKRGKEGCYVICNIFRQNRHVFLAQVVPFLHVLHVLWFSPCAHQDQRAGGGS